MKKSRFTESQIAADSCGWNLLDGANRSIDLRRAESPKTQVGAMPSIHESRMTT